MNINAIFNPTRPISLYEKEKDTRDTSFLDVLAQNAKEAYAQMAARSADAAQSTETASSKNQQPRYTLTDEEAEYFREKYGENYDKDSLADLFYELADEGIISYDDAANSTCCGFVGIMEIVGYVPPPPGVEPGKWTQINLRSGRFQYKPHELLHAKNRDIFKKEYEEFKQDYDKDVVTWEDFIQEQRDFYEYLRNRDTLYDVEGNPRPNITGVSYDERLEGLERAAEVIKQIFGQQSSGGDI